MNDDLIKQLIKVKQVYETPDGSKFDSELAAIAHIKRQLTVQSKHSHNDGEQQLFGNDPREWEEIRRHIENDRYTLWSIPPVTSNFGHISFGASKKPVPPQSSYLTEDYKPSKPKIQWKVITEDFNAPIPKPKFL